MIYKESSQEILENVVSSDSEVDHWPDRNYLTDNDWLAAACVERDDSADWQSCFSLQLPRPTSLLTQCYVWEVSVLNQSKHGKARLNCIWKHVISKIWIESTGNTWNSSGQISQDSLQWEFSTRFKRWWLNQSVNQSNSKERSCSCQCTMTPIGENEETEKIVLRMLWELPSVLEDSRKGTGHFWDLDRRRNGTELMSTKLMENGRKLLKAICSTSPKADVQNSVQPAR